MTPLVIQKFGGTSVASAEGREALVARVTEAREAGSGVVVVVSAMGRKGSPYATDTLLALLEGNRPDARECDMLAACGEVISAVVLAHGLRAAGVPARAFTGAQAGILTDAQHTSATVVGLDPSALREALAADVVPVVAGFQGCSAEGETTTLGRGGSDTTACALGVALKADAVEIYTDVDGVMTADPRECGQARVLDAMEYEELFQMARHGSRVMHAPAAELAMEGGVPVRIRNTFSDAKGTLVTEGETVPVPGARRVATAVSHVDGVAQLRVSLPDEDGDLGRMKAQTRLYRALAAADVSLDMFTPCGDTLVFTVDARALPQAIDTLDGLAMPYEVSTDLAKVTLVGAGMRGVPGVMARMAEALYAAKVTVLQTADSHTTISVLVWQNMRKAAVSALHEAFGLGEAR
jgi:aspartate kinase